MGVESFYANLTVEGAKEDVIPRLFAETPAYGRAIGYHWDDSDSTLSVSATKVCFFPACRLLYRLCSSLVLEGAVIRIETRRVEHPFDFASFIDFFAWFYKVWEEPLAEFDRDWGAFLVPYWKYYKSRSRLRKKYYVTIPKAEEGSEK